MIFDLFLQNVTKKQIREIKYILYISIPLSKNNERKILILSRVTV